MEIIINHYAVIVAAISSIVMGSLWYGPLFGKQWMALMGFTQEQMEAAKKKGMTKSYLFALVGSFLTAYVLAYAIAFTNTLFGTQGGVIGITVGYFAWLGFVVPASLSTVLWEGRPWKLFFLNIGYYLALFVVMGAILGAWM